MTDPGGAIETWTVRRRWAPRLGRETVWRRFRRRYSKTVSKVDDLPAEGCGEAMGEGLLVGIGLVLLALLLVFVVIPLVVAVVDLLVVLLVAAASLGGRILFRRPWTLEAASDQGRTYRWSVVGWRRSGESAAEARELLAAGIIPPDAHLVDGGPG